MDNTGRKAWIEEVVTAGVHCCSEAKFYYVRNRSSVGFGDWHVIADHSKINGRDGMVIKGLLKAEEIEISL